MIHQPCAVRPNDHDLLLDIQPSKETRHNHGWVVQVIVSGSWRLCISSQFVGGRYNYYYLLLSAFRVSPVPPFCQGRWLWNKFLHLIKKRFGKCWASGSKVPPNVSSLAGRHAAKVSIGMWIPTCLHWQCTRVLLWKGSYVHVLSPRCV